MVETEILSYIRQQLASGYEEEGIRRSLASYGWKPDAIEEAFTEAKSSTPQLGQDGTPQETQVQSTTFLSETTPHETNRFEAVTDSWGLIKTSAISIFYYPKLLVPLLYVWLIYAFIVYYIKYQLPWTDYSVSQIFLSCFLVVLLLAFLLAYSMLSLLKLIQQHENGEKMSLYRAGVDAFTQDLLTAAPLVIVWAILSFILDVLQAFFDALTGKAKRISNQSGFSAQDFSQSMSGVDQEGNAVGNLFFAALQKSMRMTVFMILPAIALENLPLGAAFKRGVAIMKAHASRFALGFALTSGAAAIIFLPSTIILELSDKGNVQFPDIVWYINLTYMAFAWSYSIYLEQMYTAELYIWHLNWEKAIKEAQLAGNPAPRLSEVPMPSLIKTRTAAAN